MFRICAVVMTLAVMAGACGDASRASVSTASEQLGGSDSVTSTVAPPSAGPPVVSVGDAELAALVAGTNEFAASIYRVLADDDDANLALGPWSISEGLALSFVGARGTTAAQMADVLQYDLPGDTQHAAFHTLRQELLGRQNDGVSIAIANRLFGQEGFAFLDEFLAAESRFYEAPLGTVDFGEPETARATINDWTADRTGDRITELFPAGSIDPTVKLVLVNAIHLDADWFFPFNPDNTVVESFTTPGGSTVDVATMKFNEYLPISTVGGHTAVQVPYSGGEMSMIVVLPGTTLPGLESDLDADFFAAVNDGLTDSGIHLALPKFELSSHRSLIEPLRELGLTEPFDDADFSGMTGGADLSVSAIEHEAFVQIDEVGTEAAAATGTAMASSHGPTVEFDRPFLFYVQDDVTGTILFLGRVTDPTRS